MMATAAATTDALRTARQPSTAGSSLPFLTTLDAEVLGNRVVQIKAAAPLYVQLTIQAGEDANCSHTPRWSTTVTQTACDTRELESQKELLRKVDCMKSRESKHLSCSH